MGGVAGFERIQSMSELIGAFDRAGPAPAAHIDVDGARLARELKNARYKRIGLLPTSSRVDVLGLARALGGALAALTETLVLIIDVDRRSSDRVASEPEAIYGQIASNGLALLSKGKAPGPGEKAAAIRELMSFAAEPPDAYGRILVDLSSCTRPGELLGALALLDGVIVVGVAGKTTEKAALRTSSRIPREQNLGLILVE